MDVLTYGEIVFLTSERQAGVWKGAEVAQISLPAISVSLENCLHALVHQRETSQGDQSVLLKYYLVGYAV